MAGATAGTSLASWLARLVVDEPTELTVLLTPAGIGTVGLLPPKGGGTVPAVPPPGEPPEDAEGGGKDEVTPVPVVVAAPIRVTCPPTALPVSRVRAGGTPRERAPEPTSLVSEPGAVGPVVATPEVERPLCGRARPCVPCAATLGAWC